MARPCAKHKRFVKQCVSCVKKRETAERASRRAHAKRVIEMYGISDYEYQAILDLQGGCCAICGRFPGKKRLAVDHDHALEAAGIPRRETVRGLLCRNCNFHVVGGLRNDPDAFLRGYRYLIFPPARAVLNGNPNLP
jgi:recombination endonuclease VII